MELQLNGKDYQAQDKITVKQLLNKLDLDPQRVVVELNQRILTIDQHPEIHLASGDKLEIVQFVGGG